MIIASSVSSGASFDCKKASTIIEKLTCADADLSKLDDEMNSAYLAVLKNTKDAELINP
jgi:uncharacterized protein